MSHHIGQAREEMLAAAHRVISGRIDDRPQGPNDDAEAEYADDELVRAAQKLARAKLAERLEKLGDGGPRSALQRRLDQLFDEYRDDASAAGAGDHRIRAAADEAAVMELALLEIASGVEAATLHAEEAREIATDALPDGAGKKD